ncbi:unnamed protein product, partial [Meganyctiphanes norvegica]
FWLGASDTGTETQSEGVWHWSNGELIPADFPWSPGKPNNSTGAEHCLIISSSGYIDEPCSRKHNFVCEPRGSVICSGNYTLIADQCLSFNDISLNQSDAENTCENMGGKLASINIPQALLDYKKQHYSSH